jgi:hypothetical protein
MVRLLFIWVLGLMPSFLAPVQAQTSPDPVAIVTDILGKVETQHGSSAVVVALLAEFSAGSRAKLQPGAKMVVLYLRSGEQYALAGPALMRFGWDAPEPLNGTKPAKMRPVVGQDGTPIRIKPGGLAQSGIIVRSLGKGLSPMNLAGTITLERTPVFRWKDTAHVPPYQFELKDDRGMTLVSSIVNGDSLKLPPEVRLQEGQSYYWSVGSRPGIRYNDFAESSFQVADAELQAAVENYRPRKDASIAERVAYAIWLDQTGLRDEASAQWRRIAEDGGPVPAQRREGIQ